jgi:hypothetical protein
MASTDILIIIEDEWSFPDSMDAVIARVLGTPVADDGMHDFCESVANEMASHVERFLRSIGYEHVRVSFSWWFELTNHELVCRLYGATLEQEQAIMAACENSPFKFEPMKRGEAHG